MSASLHLPLHLSHAADAADGGIASAVAELSTAQEHASLHPTWLTADRFPPRQRDRALRAAVLAAAPELVHLHGLWRSPTRIAPRLAAAGLPLLIAPHGMLDPWALAQSRWKKRLVWRLWEHRALAAASCLQALCSAEVAAIRALVPQTPIALIPNGVALPDRAPVARMALPPPPWADAVPPGDRVLLFLGRFHHKKGLDPLLAAWQAVAAQAASRRWWLVLVGYGDAGALASRVAAAQLRGELPRVLVQGPCFGDDKASVLAAASGFVLPSFSEGLPMAALEAMAHQLPCLLSGACNLPEAFVAGAALPAEPDPVALAASLQQLLALSVAERSAMGAACRALVAERYSWLQVAQQTRQLYSWILGGGARPGFVELRPSLL
ncbi:glycosyltransferase [Synechococcus sp. CBW1006]|uniref:glycosyltransferase n=1 Tax=Synechococcus sp. CBW1006 TaxID=1353138 RepID=UPI001E446F45|nr:glycosyltransferase [Synechococcus sp. CBW1006]